MFQIFESKIKIITRSLADFYCRKFRQGNLRAEPIPRPLGFRLRV